MAIIDWAKDRDNLNAALTQTIEAAVTVREISLKDMPQWVEVYQGLQKLLFTALCDPFLAGNAATILAVFLNTECLLERILSDSIQNFVKALYFVFTTSRDDIKCVQPQIEQFIRSLHSDNSHELTKNFV